jgi:hypothetical protein
MLHGIFLNKNDVCKLFVHNLDSIGFLLVVTVINFSSYLLLKEISQLSNLFFANLQNEQSSIWSSWENNAWIISLKHPCYSSLVHKLFVDAFFPEGV